MKKTFYGILMGLLFITTHTIYAASSSRSQPQKTLTSMTTEKENHANESLIKISAEGQQAAGIKTARLKAKSLPIYLSVPGVVIPNADTTAIVTPRIQAQVIQRLVQVGEQVKTGQVLVRLSSVDMANAQANLLLAKKEWQRVKTLGKQAVSAKRYQIAEIAYQQAYSKLLAYGMTRPQIDAVIQSNDPNKANGEFTLLAQRDGTVFQADFTEGQMIEPGRILFKIVDETNLWVDARLSNTDSTTILKGAKAMVQTSSVQLPAEVLQVHHKLDEATRTRIVRLTVSNISDQLHPGEFVTCLINTGETPSVLAVKSTALMRTPDGDMAIYIEVKPNYFQAKEVKVIKKVGSWRVIEGVNAGVRVVTAGAFFVHSEALKSGFSTHDH